MALEYRSSDIVDRMADGTQCYHRNASSVEVSVSELYNYLDTFVVRSDNICISLLPLTSQTPFHHPDQ